MKGKEGRKGMNRKRDGVNEIKEGYGEGREERKGRDGKCMGKELRERRVKERWRGKEREGEEMR